MTGTIVVGVSHAPVCARAVEWALARAKSRGQQIELLSIVGGSIGMAGEGIMLAAAREDAEELVRTFATQISGEGVAVRTRVTFGDPVSQLIEATRTADLLVLGSDYQGPEGPRARGSHGIRVVAGAECPVVVVPDLDVEGRKGVVVGVDGSELSERAIAFAAAEADRLGEPLIAVSVWTAIAAPRNAAMVMPEEYRAGMTERTEAALALSLAGLRAKYPGLEIHAQVAEGYPAEVINRLAATTRLAVVGSRGRGPIRRFLLGSISHEVLQRLATVTVVVR